MRKTQGRWNWRSLANIREHVETSEVPAWTRGTISLTLIAWSSLCRHLLSSQRPSGNHAPKSINDVMPVIGARFYNQLDAIQGRYDILERELSKVCTTFVTFSYLWSLDRESCLSNFCCCCLLPVLLLQWKCCSDCVKGKLESYIIVIIIRLNLHSATILKCTLWQQSNDL